MLLADGALARCTAEKCNKFVGKTLSDAQTLGELRVASKKQYTSITRDSVFYRCLTCRARFAENRGSLNVSTFARWLWCD